ncbi:hypothetical protein ScPMuIL_018605 [Solemya velum]
MTKDQVLQAIRYLNPDTKEKILPEDVANLSDIFLSITPELKAKLEDEAHDYTLTPRKELSRYDATTAKPVPVLLSKVMLTLSHFNADTERTFSMIKKIQTVCRDNLDDKTLHSLLRVKINNTDDCPAYKPQTNVVRSGKNACATYKSSNTSA